MTWLIFFCSSIGSQPHKTKVLFLMRRLDVFVFHGLALSGFQLSKTAESADSDDKSFNNYVEMLIQKGHVLDTSSSYPNMVCNLLNHKTCFFCNHFG